MIEKKNLSNVPNKGQNQLGNKTGNVHRKLVPLTYISFTLSR